MAAKTSIDHFFLSTNAMDDDYRNLRKEENVIFFGHNEEEIRRTIEHLSSTKLEGRDSTQLTFKNSKVTLLLAPVSSQKDKWEKIIKNFDSKGILFCFVICGSSPRFTVDINNAYLDTMCLFEDYEEIWKSRGMILITRGSNFLQRKHLSEKLLYAENDIFNKLVRYISMRIMAFDFSSGKSTKLHGRECKEFAHLMNRCLAEKGRKLVIKEQNERPPPITEAQKSDVMVSEQRQVESGKAENEIGAGVTKQQQCNLQDILSELNIPSEKPLTYQDLTKIRGVHLDPSNHDFLGSLFTVITSLDHRISNVYPVSDDRSVQKTQDKAQTDKTWHDALNSAQDFHLDKNDKMNVSFRDILFLIYNHADPFLQQELITKMSLCQHAVPFLLPDKSHDDISFLLWGNRGVIKSWKENGELLEKAIISHNMPFVSFIRLENIGVSKSNIINKIISKIHKTTDYPFFLNNEVDGRESFWSNGTVESLWVLPQNEESSEKLKIPIGVLNLRGDGAQFARQYECLCQISSIMVLFVTKANVQKTKNKKCIDDAISCCPYCIIVITADSDTLLNKYENPKIQFVKKATMVDVSATNNLPQIANEIWRQIYSNLHYDSQSCSSTLDRCLDVCDKLKIKIDERKAECKSAQQVADEILQDVFISPRNFKGKVLTSRSVYWKKWSTLDKNATSGGNENRERLLDENHQRKRELREEQCKIEVAGSMWKFQSSLVTMEENERLFLLSWLKHRLNLVSSLVLKPLIDQMSNLSNQFRNCQLQLKRLREIEDSSSEGNIKELEKLVDELWENRKEVSAECEQSSLGLEHFIRELGQIYECHKQTQRVHPEIDIDQLPKVAAQMLLDGFPVEVFDGDVSYVPLTWFQAVLRSLEGKVGDKKVFVISVIGIQSSGKSTLLNSMFGVRFAVSAGCCTRGVFMQILPVDRSIGDELQCDYIIVIDTEGLRAPERVMTNTLIEDNELATLAMCLSDLTLINISGQTVTKDMTDVLENAAHAFIRMRGVDLHSECRLVQQFVADISAQHRNMTSTETILANLDEATAAASRAEGKQSQFLRFQDVFNLRSGGTESDFQYIPSLWRGGLMDPPDHHYSKNILGLKASILKLIKLKKKKVPTATLR